MPRRDEMENPYHCVNTHNFVKNEFYRVFMARKKTA